MSEKHGQEKWTAGPWALLDHWPLHVVAATDRRKKLGMAADPEVDRREYARIIVDARYSLDRFAAGEPEANAHLIATAPTLYEALRDLLEAAEARAPDFLSDISGADASHLYQRVCNALALARGEASELAARGGQNAERTEEG